MAWIFIADSRPVSVWLRGGGGATDTTAQYLDGSPVDRAFLTVLIAAALIVLAARGPKVKRLLRSSIPVLLFLLYCFISISWSDFPDIAFKRWIRVLGDLAMVVIVVTDPDPSAAFKKLLTRLAIGIIPLSVFSDAWRWQLGRAYRYGLTSNKNMYGATAMTLGLGMLWLYLTMLRSQDGTRTAKRLFTYGSLAIMTAWCVLQSNSTTSQGCFLVGGFLVFMIKPRVYARRTAVIHLLVPILVLLACYVEVINPNVGVVASLGKDPTLTGRTDVWEAVLSLTPSPLIGAGFETFWTGERLKTLWTIFPWWPNESHNGYIEIYANLGWAGLTLFAFMMAAGYRNILRGIRLRSPVANLRLAYFTVAIIYSLTEAGFRMFSPVWLTLLLCLVAAPVPEADREGGVSRSTEISAPEGTDLALSNRYGKAW